VETPLAQAASSVQWPENFSETVDKYFMVSLEKMGLLDDQINSASVEELQTLLTTVDFALSDTKSFGVCKLSLSGSAGFHIVKANTDSHFEFGIMPILISARSKILSRLRRFGISTDQSEIKFLTSEIQKHKIRFRFSVGLILFSIVLLAIFYLPYELGWSTLTQHNNRMVISALATLGSLGMIWAIFDLDKNRSHLVFGSLGIGAIIAAISLI